ncbi:FAM46A [Bugula neritina]|uniref:polynucleotide adenylyltransferase n=1 Tax=Bugula neritina TaxID=10212 RepID=A0A7J7IW61_BUGNE|nr:FAM46A [Bugula neritina]
MQDLVQKVYGKLQENDIAIVDVRVNGSLASYIVGDSEQNHLSYNDIDLIFSVNLKTDEQLLKLKDLVIQCLLTYLPKEANLDRLSFAALTDAYVSKLVKVWSPTGDKWTLVTLSNNDGMNLELKFVDTMKRKYQFSVDSFQIILDSLMQFHQLSSAEMSEDFYPTVTVESVYGDYKEALYHLNKKLICTRSPQEIRGGGLLKYCDLLARGYTPECTVSHVETLERLMCSRFFIDYSDTQSQYQKLDSYLINHFGRDFPLMLLYLKKLLVVVNTSTVCLMGHERRQALDLISQMAYHVECEVERQRAVESDHFYMTYSQQNNKFNPFYDSYNYVHHHHYYSFHPTHAFYINPCLQHVY